MALRSSYYGIKRQLKLKLQEVAAGWDSLISSLTLTKYTVTAAEGVTLKVNEVYVTGNTVNVLLRLSGSFDLTEDIFLGVIDFKPAADYAFLDIVDEATPYKVLGCALVRGTNGRVEIKKSIPDYTGSTVWIKGTYAYSGRVSASREIDTKSVNDIIPEIEEPVTKKRSTKKTVKEGE